MFLHGCNVQVRCELMSGLIEFLRRRCRHLQHADLPLTAVWLTYVDRQLSGRGWQRHSSRWLLDYDVAKCTRWSLSIDINQLVTIVVDFQACRLRLAEDGRWCRSSVLRRLSSSTCWPVKSFRPTLPTSTIYAPSCWPASTSHTRTSAVKSAIQSRSLFSGVGLLVHYEPR